MLGWVESKGYGSWLWGGCKGPCGVALSGQIVAGWGSGGSSAGKVIRVGGRCAGGLQGIVAKGEFLFLKWKVMEKVTARSRSCCSMSKQPSAAVICANISRDYGLGASWERQEQHCEDSRLKHALTESLPFLTLSEQECNHKTTISKVPANKPARWGLMTYVFVLCIILEFWR